MVYNNHNVVMGISISQQKVVFQIQHPPIPSFQQKYAVMIGEVIAIQYQGISQQDMSKFSYKLIKTKIPTLKFSQDSDKEQIYNLSYANDALKRIFTISATLITGDSTAIIIKNPNGYFQQTISSPQSRVIMKIEKYFIGYVSSGSISNSFQKPIFNSLEQSVVLYYPNQPDNIFSTFGENYILKSSNNENNEFTLTIIPAKSPVAYGKITLNKPLISVDEQSGFFLNTNEDGARQINVFFDKENGDNSYYFQTINPGCDDKSLLLFSGDILNNQVVVLCGKSLKLYRFNYHNKFIVQISELTYPSDEIVGSITKIEIQPTGLLYITDNQQIVAININLNILVGSVKIPPNTQGQFTGKIIFFTQSFVVARNDNNSPSIQQYSYNQFDRSLATSIRTFLNFGFQWTGIGVQAIKDFNINSNQEFLVVEALIDKNNVKKLFYRVSGQIQAQNQLLITFNIEKTTPYLALPQVFGYYSNKQLIFMDLSYELTLEVSLNITPNQFITQIGNLITGQLTLNDNDNYSLKLNFNYFRSVQPSATQIMNQNQNVVNFKNHFLTQEIRIPSSYKFDDKQFTNGHLFGWKKNLYDTSYIFNMQFTQRLVNNADSTKKLESSYNQLLVMPNAIMIAKPEGIFVEGLKIELNNFYNCYFYKDGVVEISTKLKQTIVSQVVYFISKDSNNIFFSKITIQGVYDSYPNSKPDLSLTNSNQYQTSSAVLNEYTFITIQFDKTLGILALLKYFKTSKTQVCLIQLPQNTAQKIFTLDCDIYSSFSNLFISNIIYIESAQQNIFVTQYDQIYYGFSSDLSNQQVINYRDFLIMKGLQFNKHLQVNRSQKISDSTILISYLNGNTFKIALNYEQGQIQILDSIQTLYQYDSYLQVSDAFMNEQNQIFILLANTKNSADNIIAMYEEYYISKKDYLIRSSYPISYTNNVKQSILCNYYGNLIFGINCINDYEKTTPLTFNIFDQPQMYFQDLKYRNQVNKGTTLTFGFSIAPINQVNNVLLLQTPVTVNSGGKVPSSTFAFILKYQFYLILIFYLF